ncbi:tripartite motif-containing protein 16-like [Carassius auratus]|uniref:Tripartite motif-containing protein 16-like n=1 Tax=Carassius auratus TaxID=7957 RepID=A0A6P6J933_CARAU|nr:tripartite motif-containing protein 16-like [Carassius auratus]
MTKQVGETVIIVQKKIQERQTELQKLRKSAQSHKRSAQAAVEHSERIFTELIRSIERRCSEVIQMIRDREKAEVSRAEGLLEQLQQEIDDLRRRNAELKQLLHTDNHIHFLQSFPFLSVPPASSESTTVSSLLTYDDVRSSVSIISRKFENFCREEIEKIPGGVKYSIIPNIKILTPITEPKTREDFLHYYHQFTLDSESVHKNLYLSEENKVAACTATVQPYPDHPDMVIMIMISPGDCSALALYIYLVTITKNLNSLYSPAPVE